MLSLISMQNYKKIPYHNTILHIIIKLIAYFRAYLNKKQYFCSPKGRPLSFGLTQCLCHYLAKTITIINEKIHTRPYGQLN